MTVLEVIQRSTEFLTKKGVESPRLQVELLLAQQLKLPRMQIYLNFERVLSVSELEGVREMVRRRGLREPLQHIVGSACFCGYEFTVNPQVLVPRPETELLAEYGWTFLQSRNHSASHVPTVLDWGTGSGCLAVTLAVKCPTAQAWAVDISPEALSVARQNAGRNQVSHRIQFLEGPGFQAVPPGSQFDLIVSNPPYIPAAEIETLDPEVRDFDPRLALNGGADGLDCYRALAAEAPAFLRDGGRLALELGDDQSPAVRELLEREKWIVEAVKNDYAGKPRILIARR